MKEISVQDAFTKLATGEVVAIDVRELDEFTAGHIEGADFNPMSSFDVSKVPTNTPVVVICRSGNRSGRVCEALLESHPNLLNMIGGMQAWALVGYEMVSDTGEPHVL